MDANNLSRVSVDLTDSINQLARDEQFQLEDEKYNSIPEGLIFSKKPEFPVFNLKNSYENGKFTKFRPIVPPQEKQKQIINPFGGGVRFEPFESNKKGGNVVEMQPYVRIKPEDRAFFKRTESRAATGNPYYMCVLGALYNNGCGTPIDKEKAIKLHRKAAALGDPNSIGYLGRFHMGETHHKAKVNPEKAFVYLKKAIKMGENSFDIWLERLIKKYPELDIDR